MIVYRTVRAMYNYRFNIRVLSFEIQFNPAAIPTFYTGQE